MKQKRKSNASSIKIGDGTLRYAREATNNPESHEGDEKRNFFSLFFFFGSN